MFKIKLFPCVVALNRHRIHHLRLARMTSDRKNSAARPERWSTNCHLWHVEAHLRQTVAHVATGRWRLPHSTAAPRTATPGADQRTPTVAVVPVRAGEWHAWHLAP